MAYAAVLFDLFDTLVRFDHERLPLIEVNGRQVRSTAGQLHELLHACAPHVTLAALYAALVESWREAERRRGVDHREVAASERFAHLFHCLDLDPEACPAGLLLSMIEAHRHGLAKAVEFPSHHATLLARLGRRHRLGVVSNFDYSPTALGILRDAGIADLFGTVVVSDAVGWRKPAPAIFHEALGRLAVLPEEALFVGDRAEIDVLGAQRVGMDAAWLNPAGGGLPAGVAPPRFEIRDLGELVAILGV